nr:MAG TPA: hypothetical protein [Caudoviricetes sp.]
MIKYQVYTAKDKQVILPEGEITKAVWDSKKSELDTYRTTQTNKILTDLRARTKKDSKNDHRAIFMDLANGVIIWARLLAGDTLTSPKVATEYFYLRTPKGNTEINFTELFSKWEIPDGNTEVDKVIKALFEKYKELQKAELAGKTIDQVALKDELVKLIKKYVDAKIAEIPTTGGTPAPVSKETIINLLKEAADPTHPESGNVLIALLTEHLAGSSASMTTLLSDENGSKPFKYFLKLNNLYGAAADIDMFKEMYDTASPNIVCGVNRHRDAMVQNLDILDLNAEGKDSDTPLTPTEIFVDKENTVTKDLPPEYSLMVYRSIKYAKEVRPSDIETEEHYINGKGQPEDTYVPSKVRTIGVENVLKHFANNVCPSLYLEKQANGSYSIGNEATANLFKKYIAFLGADGKLPDSILPASVSTITNNLIDNTKPSEPVIKETILKNSMYKLGMLPNADKYQEYNDDGIISTLGTYRNFVVTLTRQIETFVIATNNIPTQYRRDNMWFEGTIIVKGAKFIKSWGNMFVWREGVPTDLGDMEVFAYVLNPLDNKIYIGRV